MGTKQAVVGALCALLFCTHPPAPDWHYSPYRREIDPSEYEAVKSPYYGQYWSCACSDGFMMVRIDTVQVRHVWSKSVLPMSGQRKFCTLPPEFIKGER
jgi:hypothetical protein